MSAKLFSSLVFLLAALFFLSGLLGCAEAPPPNNAVELALADAIGECHKSQGVIESARINKLTDPRDVLLDRAIAGLSAAAGGNIDPCDITTNNDLQKTAMEENTKQIAAGMDFGKQTVGSLIVGVGVWKGLDVLPELFGSAGYSLSSTGDMTITDSIKTASMGDILGNPDIGGILNPATATPFVVEVPGE